jgi:hypothetical protein
MARFQVRVHADSRLGYDRFVGLVNKAQDALEGAGGELLKSYIASEDEDYDEDTKQYSREFEMDIAYTQAVTP